MANLTAEEISRLVMATPPRAVDAQQFQPVVAPPDSQPDPNVQPIQVAEAQPVAAENPSFTVNPNYATSNQTFLPPKPAEAQATPPVAIALPQPAQAQHRQFTPVVIDAGEPQHIPHPPQLPSEIAAPQIGPNYAYPPGTSTVGFAKTGPSLATIGKLPAPAILPTDTDRSESPLVDKTATDQAELARLQGTGSGITQLTKRPGFFHKLGGIAARIGDIAGTALFPSITAQIPGTELHHQILMGQQRGIVDEDLGEQKKASDMAAIDAETEAKQNPPAPKPDTPEQQAFAYLTSTGMKPTDAFQKVKDMSNTKEDSPEHAVYSYLIGQGKTPVEAFGAIYDTKNVKEKTLQQQYFEALQGGDTAKASLIQRVIKDTSTQPKIEIKNAGGGGGGGMGGMGAGPLSPASQSLVDQIGLGKMSMANLDRILTKNPALMEAVAAKYPDFDQSKIKSYTSATRDFTGAGKLSIQLNSGSTAMRHLAQLKQINDANPVQVHNPTSASYKAYNNLLDTVADELGTFYGEPKTNEVIAAKKATLGGFLNRGAAIEEQARAMGAKFDELENTWNNAAPSAAYRTSMPGYSQAAKEARAKLDPSYARRSGQNEQPGPQGLTVTTPDGRSHTFKDQASADGFRQSAGIQNNQGGGVIYARDPGGKVHQAPAGSALPPGWKLQGSR